MRGAEVAVSSGSMTKTDTSKLEGGAPSSESSGTVPGRRESVCSKVSHATPAAGRQGRTSNIVEGAACGVGWLGAWRRCGGAMLSV
ncbi:unnamed protein product [Chondrus crispus]|uniref:Uncharacterized protein n=1 Tax=Chondrus crispus TaxID=2769 RepID=R7QJA1_CHOCR|nr:unnamed protein product [Chondrus crispus]CDF37843.1 unnamed protein product [Chondrus crispus]|eukprot:XP_005717714.1 unnamed protein product [Chondrus crispus]